MWKLLWEEKPDTKSFRSNLDVNVSLYFFLPPSLPLHLSVRKKGDKEVESEASGEDGSSAGHLGRAGIHRSGTVR